MADNPAPTAPVEQALPTSGSEILEPEKTVSHETYLKTLAEAKNAKKRLKELEDAEKVRTEKEMADRGEYQKLLSQRDEELKKIRDEMADFQRTETNRQKLAGVLGLSEGNLDSKWYGLIDYEAVVIDPATGKADPLSVAKVWEDFKKRFPEAIPNPHVPRLPNTAPQGSGVGKIKRSEWSKLPITEMKKWKFDQIED